MNIAHFQVDPKRTYYSHFVGGKGIRGNMVTSHKTTQDCTCTCEIYLKMLNTLKQANVTMQLKSKNFEGIEEVKKSASLFDSRSCY